MFQRIFAPETFADRRRRVAERIGAEAVALVQGARGSGSHDQFRQSNELFYLCGVEVPHAYLVVDGADGTAALFLPHQDGHSVEAEGEHLSTDNAEGARELTGVDRVAALEKLPAALRGATVVFTPLSPAEGARSSWDTLRRAQEEAEADPFDGGVAREAAFAGLLRQRCPAARIEDLSPILDEMRLVKDVQEVAVLREAGAICADALTACMRATAPGVMEYQLAGVLGYHYRVSGSRGASYHPIIAGGTNSWYGHYSANDQPLADGDLVLVDCAPDHHYYTSDITRMWPVNGTYSDTQRALYGFMIAYHKALLAGIRPGRTDDEIHDEAAQVMAAYLDRTPFANPVHVLAARSALEFSHHLSHPVGMAVHDVSHYRGKPLRPGIVFSVDPQMRIPEERLYLRVEDTVVVTEDGCEKPDRGGAAGDGRGRGRHARTGNDPAVPGSLSSSLKRRRPYAVVSREMTDRITCRHRPRHLGVRLPAVQRLGRGIR